MTKAFNKSYIGTRPTIRALVPKKATKILDIGCSVGAVGAAIKQERPQTVVVGIEMGAEMAQIAAERLDRVFCADVTTFDWSLLSDMTFDCLLFGDILEHLPDPWTVFESAVARLEVGGYVVVSLPNIRHISSFYSIYVRGVWPMRERGIHDRTHLRFFTLKSIYDLFASVGCTIEQTERNYRLIERKHRINNQFVKVCGPMVNILPIIREFLTFQYLVLGQKTA